VQVLTPPGIVPSVPAPNEVPAREDASWLGSNWQGSSAVCAVASCGVPVSAGMAVIPGVAVGLGVTVGFGVTVALGVLDATVCCGALVTVGVEELQAESSAAIANTQMLIADRARPRLTLVR
jgi:hypothetical protein